MKDEEDPVITIRVPAEWLRRADRLTRALSKLDDVRQFGPPTRSTVARLALLRGLVSLENEYGKVK